MPEIDPQDLAERYRSEAEACRHMASVTYDGSQKDAWLLLCIGWTSLAQNADARRQS
jgi:hypothetical protein